MEVTFGSRLKHAWNAFLGNEFRNYQYSLGPSSSYRPDRPIFSRGNERSIITSVYNRIALDAASVSIQHVRLDDDERFTEVIHSDLNNCLSLEANLDQTGRAFVQDVVMLKPFKLLLACMKSKSSSIRTMAICFGIHASFSLGRRSMMTSMSRMRSA